MAQFRQGDMLAPENWNTADLVLITTNATLNDQASLVMGAGIARQVRDRFPGLDKALAREITARATAFSPFEHQDRRYRVYSPPYGLIVSPNWPGRKLGLFQVKVRFYQPASLDLIMQSTSALLVWQGCSVLAMIAR